MRPSTEQILAVACALLAIVLASVSIYMDEDKPAEQPFNYSSVFADRCAPHDDSYVKGIRIGGFKLPQQCSSCCSEALHVRDGYAEMGTGWFYLDCRACGDVFVLLYSDHDHYREHKIGSKLPPAVAEGFKISGNTLFNPTYGGPGSFVAVEGSR